MGSVHFVLQHLLKSFAISMWHTYVGLIVHMWLCACVRIRMCVRVWEQPLLNKALIPSPVSASTESRAAVVVSFIWFCKCCALPSTLPLPLPLPWSHVSTACLQVLSPFLNCAFVLLLGGVSSYSFFFFWPCRHALWFKDISIFEHLQLAHQNIYLADS